MDEKIPRGEWVTVSEAMGLVPDVSRRRIQALTKPLGDSPPKVRGVVVLGRLLLDREQLIAWRDGRKAGRPKKDEPPEEEVTMPR